MNQYDDKHWRFARTCPGFRPERESAGWAWWIAGAVCGALILLAMVTL